MAVLLFLGPIYWSLFWLFLKSYTANLPGVLIGITRKIAATNWPLQNFDKVTGSSLSDHDHSLNVRY